MLSQANIKIVASLQACTMQKIPQKTNKQKEKIIGSVRVSLLPSLKIKLDGSLTVETALVLPLFIFAMITILYFCRIIQYTDVVYQGIHQSAREMAVKSYMAKGENIGEVGSVVGGIVLSESYVRSRVNKALMASGYEENDISYMRSRFLDDDIIDIVAVENIEMPYYIPGISSFKIMERAYVHAFTGYDNTHAQNVNNDSEEIVYITPNGEVYHRDRNCRHLKIDIHMTEVDKVGSLRSVDGSKYYECEYCNKCDNKGSCYITDYGDRYHMSVNCPALKRDVKAVELSKIRDRRACKSCGG